MGSAIFTGVTGLQVHQQRIDVIAANIANVNTTGYRSSRMLFQDLFSQTLEGARGPVGSFGGSNPQQVGLGVRVASIDTDFTQGTLLNTGVASDFAIQGSGFFILSDGSGMSYSRDGSFQINADGNLVDSATGQFVQGFLAASDGTIDTSPNALTDLAIPVGATSIVEPTTTTTMIGNLDSETGVTDTVVRTLRVFDSLGTARDIDITFTKTGVANEWTWGATSSDPDIALITIGDPELTFASDGTFLTAPDPSIEVTFGAGPPVPATLEFSLDFTQATQLASSSDVTVSNRDGFPRGTLESFNIGRGGVINGVFTNGLTRVLGQVGMANFSNEGGLIRNGSNMFAETPASGLAQIGAAGTGGRGSVSGGVLEGSNVDLGTEFSNLIVTQRGFQANARTITTADTLLQETVNLVR